MKQGQEGIVSVGRFFTMNNKRFKIILGIATTVIAIVAIMFGFASAFGDIRNYPSSRGTMFQVMFGHAGYENVPALIVAFVFLIVAAVFALISSFLPGKLGLIGFGLVALLLVAGGIMIFFTPNLFLSANADVISAESLKENPVNAGLGVYGMGIISIVGGVAAAYCARLSVK